MCGRTACLLPGQLCKACSGNETRRYKGEPKWREAPGGVGEYKPRYNLGPSVYSPVLVGGHHFVQREEIEEGAEESDDDEDEEEYEADDLVIQPMHWGLVPAYHKGEPKEFRYRTINARKEGLMDKPTFRVPLNKGRRCVVLADGFYEWQRAPEGKQPYFVYFPQRKDIQWDHPERDDGGEAWTGRRPLTMAGIFEINHQGEYPRFGYTIITVPASKKMAWMHDRMPALLDGDDAVDQWLDSQNVPLEKAIELLKPVENISYHAVTPTMGNIRTQGSQCIIPFVKKKEPVQKPTDGTLLQYFKPSRQSDPVETKSEEDEESEDDTGPAPKVPKK